MGQSKSSFTVTIYVLLICTSMASAAVTPENLWGKLKEPSKVNLPAASEGEEALTKASIRTCLWEFLERSDIANYPRNEWLESKCCSAFEFENITS